MKTKNKVFFICLMLITTISLLFCIYLINHKVTQQCEIAYEDYMDYMQQVNKIAIDNGFKEQPTVLVYEFCKD